MKKIVVSLVSEHTIPNILVIWHFKPDELLFITTPEMEQKGKTDAILETLKRMGADYGGRWHKVEIAEDSILDCHRKLEGWIAGREDSEFVVNLTGGTKIMSIAAYEYFKDYESRMIYVPIPRNEFIVPFPKKAASVPVPLAGRLSVVQYLTAYGQKVTNNGGLARYQKAAESRMELSEWIVQHYGQVKNLLTWLGGNLRSHRDDKEFHLSGIFDGPTAEERSFLEKFGFHGENGRITKRLNRSEIAYLTGGWLEEYCFNEVMKLNDAGIDDAVTGLKLLNRQGGDNEFDVMFTRENALYFVECKSLDQEYDQKAEVLYKIGALQKDFGLRVTSFLVSTSPHILKNGEIRPSVAARAEQFSTVVVPPGDVMHWGNRLAEKLKITPQDRK